MEVACTHRHGQMVLCSRSRGDPASSFVLRHTQVGRWTSSQHPPIASRGTQVQVWGWCTPPTLVLDLAVHHHRIGSCIDKNRSVSNRVLMSDKTGRWLLIMHAYTDTDIALMTPSIYNTQVPTQYRYLLLKFYLLYLLTTLALMRGYWHCQCHCWYRTACS